MPSPYPVHGKQPYRLYRCWQAMKARCYQLNNCKYSDYHGRGICVCDEWNHDYIAFRNWALNNGYSDNLTLDRIDNNGNYCPENCRWATARQQNNNTRRNHYVEYNGERRTISEWADHLGIPYNTLNQRFWGGWSAEKALTTPLKSRDFEATNYDI